MDRDLAAESAELQAEINHLCNRFGARPMPVGFLTNDGLNIYVADDGTYHFTFYERGKLGFDQVGTLDDVLYWYCEGLVSREASKRVGDRKERFRYEYDVLNEVNSDWAKRNVRDTAALFRRYGQAEDLSLLPDIGEPL